MILRAFEHPFSKSLTIHFLLLAMMLTYFFVSPEIKFQDEPITVSIVDHQKDQKSKNTGKKFFQKRNIMCLEMKGRKELTQAH